MSETARAGGVLYPDELPFFREQWNHLSLAKRRNGEGVVAGQVQKGSVFLDHHTSR